MAWNGNNYSFQPFWRETLSASRIVQDKTTGASIRCLWLLCAQDNHSPHVQTSVPGYGFTTIAVSLDPDVTWNYVFGVVDQLTSITFPNVKKMLYLQFSPGTFSRCFQIDSWQLINQVLRLEDTIPGRNLGPRLREAATQEEQTALVQNLLEGSQNMPRSFYLQQLSQYIWRRVLECQGNIRVKELSEETGYSEQYLRMITKRQIGLPPKQLAEQVRFQYALRDLCKNPTAQFSAISDKYMYADQAHFCRMFKRFTGVCPTTFVNSLCPAKTGKKE